MTADNVAGAAAAGWGEVDVAVVDFDEAEIGHAGEDASGGLLRDQREVAGSGGAFGAEGGAERGLAFFAADPDLLEQMIESDLVVRGWPLTEAGVGGTTVGGVA